MENSVSRIKFALSVAYRIIESPAFAEAIRRIDYIKLTDGDYLKAHLKAADLGNAIFKVQDAYNSALQSTGDPEYSLNLAEIFAAGYLLEEVLREHGISLPVIPPGQGGHTDFIEALEEETKSLRRNGQQIYPRYSSYYSVNEKTEGLGGK